MAKTIEFEDGELFAVKAAVKDKIRATAPEDDMVAWLYTAQDKLQDD